MHSVRVRASFLPNEQRREILLSRGANAHKVCSKALNRNAHNDNMQRRTLFDFLLNKYPLDSLDEDSNKKPKTIVEPLISGRKWNRIDYFFPVPNLENHHFQFSNP